MYFSQKVKKIGKFRLETLISEVFSEFLYDKFMKSYIIKISLNIYNYTYLTHSGTQTLIVDAEKYHTCHVLSMAKFNFGLTFMSDLDDFNHIHKLQMNVSTDRARVSKRSGF